MPSWEVGGEAISSPWEQVFLGLLSSRWGDLMVAMVVRGQLPGLMAVCTG